MKVNYVLFEYKYWSIISWSLTIRRNYLLEVARSRAEVEFRVMEQRICELFMDEEFVSHNLLVFMWRNIKLRKELYELNKHQENRWIFKVKLV